MNTEILERQIEAGLISFGETLIARYGVYDYQVDVYASDDDRDNSRLRVDFHVEPIKGVREIIATTILHRAGQIVSS